MCRRRRRRRADWPRYLLRFCELALIVARPPSAVNGGSEGSPTGRVRAPQSLGETAGGRCRAACLRDPASALRTVGGPPREVALVVHVPAPGVPGRARG